MIEKNVPIPKAMVSGNAKAKYPFVDMKPGDSVFFAGAKTKGKECSAAHSLGQIRGWKFCARSMDGGLRIWRTE